MEVDQLKAVGHIILPQYVEGREEVGRVKSKLTGIASALLPFATSLRCQLNADADVRAHVELTGCGNDGLKFVQLFNNQEDALTHLLGEQCKLDEIAVLVPIADDKAVQVHIGCQHCMQLRLAAGLETDIVVFAMAHNLLHHGLHLIDLDGEDDDVISLKIVGFGRLFKAVGGLLDAVVEYLRKAEQNRRLGISLYKVIDEFLQVYLVAVLIGSDIDVALIVDTEVAYSPSSDVVNFLRVFNSPFCHRLN